MWVSEFIEKLSRAQNGDRIKVVEAYAAITGKSHQTLYRIAAKNGYDSGRVRRTDHGKSMLTDEQISFISAQLQTSARQIKGTIQDTATALSIAEDNGIIERGSISASRVTQLLRERSMSRADLDAPEPKIRMRSLHPNHVHILDASICIQYYLKSGKGFQIMDERKFYKNKPDNFTKIKQKLIRYVLADHYSHTIFVKYYLAGGENQMDLFDFVKSAWAGNKHEKWPFRGVPKVLLMDAGAANTSRALVKMLERLDIELPAAKVHNPSRQGSAEVTQNLVESKFEARLRFCPAHGIEDLNAWASDWCVWFNGSARHSRHKMTRTQCWLKITEAQLRELPSDDVLQELFANPEEERTVAQDFTISFKGEQYDVRHIPGVIPHRSKVNVILRPYIRPQVGIVFDEAEYTASPILKDAAGFRADAAVIGEEFKSLPETIVQQAKKRNENLARGEDPKAVPFAGLQVFGNHADKLDREFIPRRGNVLSVSGGFEKHISATELIKRLMTVCAMNPDLNRAIRERFGTAVPVAEADRLMRIAADCGTLFPSDLGEPAEALVAGGAL